jgi:hypothetical protein
VPLGVGEVPVVLLRDPTERHVNRRDVRIDPDGALGKLLRLDVAARFRHESPVRGVRARPFGDDVRPLSLPADGEGGGGTGPVWVVHR